ncbi:SdrD B-like domain-containing protein [Undibacterium sp.]|uniref:SdrD B-like domain-containing protein n=1 Tax=Undibacterium sp. TaxID=1914977 RepID=UPI0025FFFAF5|nr:SdrD B-like domain-containing protein [Undibacterium sp.]
MNKELTWTHRIFSVLGSLSCGLLLGLPLQAAAVDLLVSNFTDTPDPAVRGGSFVYSASITNNTADTAHNVTLVFALDAATNFVSVSDAACNYAAGTHRVTCSYATLAGDISGPGSAQVFNVDVSVRSLASAASTVSATASVSSTDVDTNPGNDTLLQVTTIDNGADLALSLTPNVASVVASGNVIYTAASINNGPNTSGAVSVAITLSPNISFQSATGSGWSCGVAGQLVSCTRGAAAVGSLPDIVITGKVTGVTTGTITSTGVVAISGPVTDVNAANNGSTADITVTAGTDLSIVKSASSSAPAGGQAMTFTLAPRNLGPFSAANVSVVDTLPDGFTAIGAVGAGWTCAVSAQTVTCNAANYAVGAISNIVVSATTPLVGSSTPFTNTATISSSTPDGVSANNSASVNFNVMPDGVDLSISKSKSPNPVAQGGSIASTLRVTNHGPQAARAGEVKILETLMAGEIFVGITSGSNWTCDAPSGLTVTCTYNASLARNASTSSLVLNTTASGSGTLTNSACASYTDTVASLTDPLASNDCASASVISTATAASVDLRMQKTVDLPTLAWNAPSLTYTLIVSNAGPGDADGVVVSDPIPGYVAGSTTVVAAMSGGTSGATFNCTAGGTVTCTQTSGVIASGTTAIFTVSVTRPLYDSAAQPGGVWKNTASVTSTNQGDTDLSNNSGFVNVNVEPLSDVSVHSSVSPASTLAGTNATYVLTVNNNGPSTATGVSLNQVFSMASGSMTFISATPSAGSCAAFNSASKTLFCDLAGLIKGGTATVTVVVRPDYMVAPPSPRTITSDVTVTSTANESNYANNAAQSVLSVTQDALDLLINLTDSPDPLGFVPASANPVFPDNIVTYHNLITNRGPSVASGLVLSYTMRPPAGKTMTFLGDKLSASGQSYTNYCDNLNALVTGPATLTITCTFPSAQILPASNSTSSLYLDFRVDAVPASTGDTYSSTASITSNEVDTVLANNSVNQTTTVRQRVDLQVGKTARAFIGGTDVATSTVQIRQPFYWVVTVTNAGPGDSAVTTLTDNLPAGVSLYTGGTIAPYNAAPYTTGVRWNNNNATPANGTCSGTSIPTLICNLGLLEAGKVATVLVPVVSNSVAARNNCASASTSEVDPNSANNTNICSNVTVQSSSLAGSVYSDLNNDGVKAAGEPGISGVSLRLDGSDRYGNSFANLAATSNASGNFNFANLSPGTYTLSETQPTGYQDGKDTAGTAGGVAAAVLNDAINAIALAENFNATGYLFGELTSASISGYVFVDLNSNAKRDLSESAGLTGVTISLSGIDDLGATINLTTITAANGAYSFSNLRPGNYQVVENIVSGVSHTGMSIGSKGGNDGASTLSANSIVPGSDKRTISNIVLAAGDSASNYNFGESGQGLSGFVYADLNNNGIKDANEPGIAGVKVSLSGNTANADVCAEISPNPCTITTDSNGAYNFNGVPASNAAGYTLTQQSQMVAPLSSYGDGIDTLGTVNGSAAGIMSNDKFSGIVIGVGQVGSNYNFGERAASLAGSVYQDLDLNGSLGVTDVRLQNVRITLSGTTASGANVCSVIASCARDTDVDGNFSFTGLPASNNAGYLIVQTQPVDFSDAVNSVGSAGGVAGSSGGVGGSSGGNSQFSAIVLGAGQNAANYLFGEKTGSISGYAYYDANNNGIKDAGESGIAGVVITLSGTAASGAVPCSPCQVTTAGDGSYTLSGLRNANPAGYTLTETQPSAYMDGKSSKGSLNAVSCASCVDSAANVISAIPFVASQTALAFNFGEVLAATISGRVFHDFNNNQTLDADEALAGVVVTLSGLDDRGVSVNQVTSSATNGSYVFNTLRPSGVAGYSLSETQPAGLGDYAGSSGSLVGKVGGATVGVAATNLISGIYLPPNAAGTEYNFRENASSLSGSVYLDANKNGIRDAGEVGISGIAIALGGSVNRSAVTDAQGNFTFSGLFAGTYTLSETQPFQYVDGNDASGSLGGTLNAPKNTISNISLSAGTHGSAYLFGEKPVSQSSLSGTVYADNNKNGIYDVSETLLPNVVLRLAGNDYLGQSVSLTATTNSSGVYSFINIPPGSYTLTETQPSGYDDFVDATGTKPGVLAGGVAAKNSLTGLSFPLTGVAASGYDFREITAYSSIAGMVYVDANANSQRDANELLLANVSISLSGTDVNQAPVSKSVVTDANGAYRFTELVMGNYSLSQTQPVGYGDFKGNAGSKLGSSGGTLDAAANKINAIALPANLTATGYDFRENGASLAGFVYRDDNNNGVKESNELPIANVTIRLSGTDIKGSDLSLTSTSAADGSFSFTGLLAGTYTLTETQPGTWTDGKETAGTIDAQVMGVVDNSSFDSSEAKNRISQIVLGAGQAGLNYLFGEYGGSLQGYVYLDQNNNGQKDSAETGIAAVTITLSGMSAEGVNICSIRSSCVTRTDANGAFSFDGLPPGRYQLVETQSDIDGARYGDGKETAGLAGGSVNNANFGSAPYQNTISSIVLSAEVLASSQGKISGYLFGETARGVALLQPPLLGGYVWMDRTHSRVRPTETAHEGIPAWTVILTQNSKLICTVTTDDRGHYQFNNLRCPGYETSGLPTGSGFEIKFSKDGNSMPNVPTSGGAAGVATNGSIGGITLNPNDDISEQNLPLDPSGIVYDSLTRKPLAGAAVSVSGPPGFDPSRHLLGGAVAATQITGSDGLYQFLLQNNFPAGEYRLAIGAYPAGYLPQESLKIPACLGTLNAGALPNPGLVQQSNTAPASSVPLHTPNACLGMVAGGAASTQYYYSFFINSTSAPILNNHIPLDLLQAAGLSLSKTGDKQQIEMGETILYTLVLKQTAGSPVPQVTIRDSLPAGFKMLPGSVTLNGKAAADPVGVTGPVLAFNLGSLASGQQVTLTYRARAGVGSMQGDGINRARAYACRVPATCVNPISMQPLPAANPSNQAQYKVKLNAGVFTDLACVAGKVFVDCNNNHIQDEEELGIPGVRMYLQDGTNFISDVEGKFSYCGLTPKSHVLKLDQQSLPRASRMTTTSNRNLGDANSLWLDVKNGELLRADFAEGSCSNSVLEQVKARRSQGGGRSVENEATALPGLKFNGKSMAAPRQATDSANQEVVKPRQGAQAPVAGAQDAK